MRNDSTLQAAAASLIEPHDVDEPGAATAESRPDTLPTYEELLPYLLCRWRAVIDRPVPLRMRQSQSRRRCSRAASRISSESGSSRTARASVTAPISIDMRASARLRAFFV